jgi:hypothetical protein
MGVKQTAKHHPVAVLIIFGFGAAGVAAALLHGPLDIAGPEADLTVLWNTYGAAEWVRLKALWDSLWADRVFLILLLILFRLEIISGTLRRIEAQRP